MLLLSISGCLVTILASLYFRYNPPGDEAGIFNLKPLVIRAVPFILVFLLFFLATPYTMYTWFGKYNDDPAYIEVYMDHLEDRSNDSLREVWINAHELKIKENEDL